MFACLVFVTEPYTSCMQIKFTDVLKTVVMFIKIVDENNFVQFECIFNISIFLSYSFGSNYQFGVD